METGIQLSWNLRFGASAKAGHKYFDWRTLICEDQSITLGQFGFNQRLMKNEQVLKVVSVSVSYLPGPQLPAQCADGAPGAGSWLPTSASSAAQLPGGRLQLLAAVQLPWCVDEAPGLWLPSLQLLACRLPSSCTPTSELQDRQSLVLAWLSAENAKMWSFPRSKPNSEIS